MYYTSNERDNASLSTGICISENKLESKKRHTEMYIFDFSTVHISTNYVIGRRKYVFIQVTSMSRESCLRFSFMSRNG